MSIFVARGLSRVVDQIGLVLLETARDRFVQSLHLAAALSATVAIVAAVAAVVLLRGVRAGSDEGEKDGREYELR